MGQEVSQVRRFWRDLGLAVGLACLAALVALAFGVRGPTVLAVGAVTGFALFAVLQWGDKIVARVGYIESPVTFRWPRWHPPVWAGKRKLRQETEALVRDIHAYLKSKPPWMAQAYSETQASHREMQAAKDENERHAIWERQTAREVERSERDGQELAERFGGRVRYVIGEYVRRGLLPASQSGSLEWSAGNRYHIQRAATELDALARKL